MVEFTETASEQDLNSVIDPIIFNQGVNARAQGFNNKQQMLSKRDQQIWTDGWITKDYELWQESELDLVDWLGKNDRELK